MITSSVICQHYSVYCVSSFIQQSTFPALKNVVPTNHADTIDFVVLFEVKQKASEAHRMLNRLKKMSFMLRIITGNASKLSCFLKKISVS